MTLDNTENQKGISHFTFIKILRKFSSKEINEFEKILKSPFFNNHTTLIKLFSELKKYYPQFSNKLITKEYLFQIVNKGKEYDDKLFRKYLSRLNKLGEEYMSILQMRIDNGRKDLNVLIQLSKRDLNEAYLRKLKEVEKSIKNENKINVDDFLMKHHLYTVKCNHESIELRILPKSEDIKEAYINLVNYFLFNSGSFLTQSDTNQYSFRHLEDEYPYSYFFDIGKIEEYIEKIKKLKIKNYEDNIFFLEIILNDLKINLSENGLPAYNNMKKLVYINSERLGDQLLYYLLQRMNVYCILESAKGNVDLHTDIFENYRMLLDKNLFNKENTGDLSLLDFRIILSSALKNNEYEWAEKFVNEKIELLKEEQRLNVRLYGNAVLLFYKKKYPEAIEQISLIRSESLPLTLDIYIIKLKLFIKMEHYDSAAALADSFRHFVTGKKHISDFHSVTLLNFIKYYKAILRLTLKKDKTKLEKLLFDLKSSSNTKEKKWMSETITELIADDFGKS